MHEPSDIVASPLDARAPATADRVAGPEVHAFSFTGSGKEYFRIWIVNLFLTVASLGIYSAWAKVRRLQYFDRNTRLAGAVFDFRGDPKAILKGRLLAVLLLASYHYAFGFSLAIGLAIVAMLLLMLPYFLRSALRFRLHNSQYRGLHFDFSGGVGGAYAAYLPPLLTFLLPGALVAIDPTGKSAVYAFLLYLGWPLMHGAMKRYQHRHLQLGAAGATYQLPARRFVKPYLVALLVAIGGLVVVAIVFGIGAYLLAPAPGTPRNQSGFAVTFGLILWTVLVVYTIYLLATPYVQVRIANLAWSNTAFPGVTIRCAMPAWAFIRLQTVNAVLTIVTLGLFRPFAVVRVHRFRLAHLTLHSTGSFEQAVAGAVRRRGGAAGDGVADFLGMDISW